MKVNGEYRTGPDKLRNDPLRSPQGNARFGQMVLKQEERLHGEQINKTSWRHFFRRGSSCPITEFKRNGKIQDARPSFPEGVG